MHPAFLYVPGARLSQAELSAARIDGHVFEIGEAYAPADLVETADLRAASVAVFVHPGTAASGPTAAWIHGAGDAAPSVHHVKRAVDRRLRPRTSARLVFHDTVLPAPDMQLIGGIAVSTPARTMLDLATALHRDPRMQAWMERLALLRPGLPAETAPVLRSLRRVPGSRVGLAALERLDLRTR
ncbi:MULTISPECIES: type IV toxin-antitoxin system AbiEi family antitoxin [unclassified Microbacterium]|uniref:type IV toxin-antitoxin system AbiEi family antitoxin n=1 Tax=unclassified Microbacterium TaxID=2609290 RepID=UPI0014030670|nr:type IV toxin-antitoxin system AbiEi family antitoxin [Microbacterium sp. TPD7012]